MAATGPDPVMVLRDDGSVTVESDRNAAVASGYRLIAVRRAALGGVDAETLAELFSKVADDPNRKRLDWVHALSSE
jgi:hypothetical protein